MAYQIKEAFYSLQGEGVQAGRPAVFCRFVGCNLWSGREEDRANAACNLCDTNFLGTDGQQGGRFENAAQLAQHLAALWPWPEAEAKASRSARPYVVLTGGEPLLQVDQPLIQALKQAGFEVAVETNGTLPVPAGIDWICVSPKGQARLQQRSGDELKLVYPQAGVDPNGFLELDFQHFVLQPLDGTPQKETLQKEAQDFTQQTLAFCLRHPRWKMGIQLHKHLRID